MNGLMIKALGFAALLIIATIAVVMSLDIDITGDSVNAITMGGAIAVATITAAVAVKYINQMKTDTASGELADENWDGIGEYKNELPSGWAYTFLAVFLWSMWYGLIGYPVNAYSQIGEYNEEVLAYNEKFATIHKDADAATLKEMGESIFLVQCAQCHGTIGDGLSGKAQDFTTRMTKEQVLDVINNGSNQLGYAMGMMPPGMASGADAEAIAAYVAGGMKGEQPAAFAACSSCHGADGKGMDGMAPNLVEYDNALLNHVLQNGKKGVIGKMPSFKTLIPSESVQEKALTVYIQSLSN
ncbi:MAG TPA: c-type cytochrome [Sulfurovum sp.]|jgi:cytochrome c oxidase cbb3-type subunit 3|nr:MAG: cytochrome C oxidase subunit III [Sulfurovum sp. 35-42-20]OYZ26308.1 MAG: cytochrome C oxidase subunit III [Sulfurovum sp. 16-42-52]OYZ49985.1 MAG: cytochrome C oxidase subunit III [Sulfurovum sp. 24-42-9]OZA46514.1 MAG: cytochrome C oxidase subunit III [Sulfurovum sp. 17-42-90]OZA59979.1 MAG: cytochrome C oxidase subunit III [Sulfurovum sp. 39-42-12]HQR73532.1 c-type cytochrome [Sulfurovum sp.]